MEGVLKGVKQNVTRREHTDLQVYKVDVKNFKVP